MLCHIHKVSKLSIMFVNFTHTCGNASNIDKCVSCYI